MEKYAHRKKLVKRLCDLCGKEVNVAGNITNICRIYASPRERVDYEFCLKCWEEIERIALKKNGSYKEFIIKYVKKRRKDERPIFTNHD